MLNCADVYGLLGSKGFDFYTGVPDSLLKDICAYITDHAAPEDHVIAANEGNAVALAMGRYLGSGRPGLVYMQNSGIGNAVNPLLSLADTEVYGIPMLLLIGWRGEPGVKDEPQHVKQGRRMTELLDAMEIPWDVLPDNIAKADATITAMVGKMNERGGPVAILVRKGTFEKYRLVSEVVTDFEMNREDAIRLIAGQLDDSDAVVSTTGKASRELYEFRMAHGGLRNDFLTVGGMGHTASIAMGLAQARPDRAVYCLDGDGSAIMHMGSLAVIGHQGPANLIHIVINNGAHDSVGGQPTAGFHADLVAIATACGYRQAATISRADEVAAELGRLRAHAGPSLLEIRVNKGARADLGRPQSTPQENRSALMAGLGV